MSQSVKLKSFEGRAASIPLSSLRLLPELQVREKKEDPDHVEFLAEVINTKKLLPRVKVIYVESGDHVGHLVVDGCHTVRAYIKAGRKKVPCRCDPEHGRRPCTSLPGRTKNTVDSS